MGGREKGQLTVRYGEGRRKKMGWREVCGIELERS